MRIKGLISILIIIGMVSACYFLITDELLEGRLEHRLSTMNGALVEIDEFTFNPTELKIGWSKLQVTNPKNTMQNTFETGKTELDIQFWPLFWNKVVVDNMQLTNFVMHTARETDGGLPNPKKKSGQKNDEADSKNESNFFKDITRQVTSKIANNANMQFSSVKNNLQIDSLMALVDLNSIHRMDSLSIALQDNYSTWDSTFTNNSFEKHVADIQTQINTINIEELKDLRKAVVAVKVVQQMIKETDSIKMEIANLKDNFQSDLDDSRNSIASIDEWINNDIKNAQNFAKLPQINAQSIGIVLFGETLLADLNRYLGYLATAREYSLRFVDAEQEKKPERYEGKDYTFSDRYDLPTFWAKKIEVSGVTNTTTTLSGIVENLSTDQRKTDKPIKINLSGTNESNTQMTLTGLLDYTTEDKQESITYSYSGFSLANTKLSPSKLLPYKLKSGIGSLDMGLNVKNRKIESSIEFIATGLNFDIESAGEQKGIIERLVKNAISNTEQIKATALIHNTMGPLKAKVSSNIDDIFLNTLRSTVQNEVEAKRRDIEQRIKNEVDDKKVEVLSLINEQQIKLKSDLKELETRVYDQFERVDDKLKALEAKKKELENAAKDGAVDAIRKKFDF